MERSHFQRHQNYRCLLFKYFIPRSFSHKKYWIYISPIPICFCFFVFPLKYRSLNLVHQSLFSMPIPTFQLSGVATLSLACISNRESKSHLSAYYSRPNLFLIAVFFLDFHFYNKNLTSVTWPSLVPLFKVRTQRHEVTNSWGGHTNFCPVWPMRLVNWN